MKTYTDENGLEVFDENLFRLKLSAGYYVFVTESLMKKINKLETKFLAEVRQVLRDNKEHLIGEDWTLGYPDGKQTIFHIELARFWGVIDDLIDRARPEMPKRVTVYKETEERIKEVFGDRR